ncbi:hypothetical protein LLH23_15425 [bacterium]|nr:hypothetical protein [bacterium]
MTAPLPDISPTPLARRLAALALIGAGVAAGVGQVVLLRELLNIAAGNELTIGLMLAGWFLWGAVGASWVGRRAARDTHTWHALKRVLVLAPEPWLMLAFSAYGVRLVPLLLSRIAPPWGVPMGAVMGLPHLVAVSLLAALPAAMLAGAQFAAGLALYARLQPHSSATGQAYGLDAVGHLAGGVLTAVLLSLGLGPYPMVVIGGVASLIGGVSVLWALGSPRTALMRWSPAAVVLLIGSVSWLATGWAFHTSRLLFKHQHPLTEIETPHGSLGVVQWGEGGVYFYSNGVPSFPSPPTPQIQHLVHFPMLQAAAWARPDVPLRALLVGGGAAGGLHEVLQYGPRVQVDYVELDPGLIRLARQYLVGRDRGALDDPRVHVWAMDGRLWVKQRSAALQSRNGDGGLPPTPSLKGGGDGYDVVILGVPEPMTAQINRFYTVEFLREAAAVMTPEGVLGLQMPSSDTYLGDELLRLDAVLLRTVREVFPQVALLPGDPMVLAASRTAALTEDAEVLRARLDALQIDAPDFRAHAWDRLFPFEVRQVRKTLDGAPPLPLNTDARPIGYFYGQAYWVAQHSRSSWAFFNGLSRLTLGHLVAAVLLLLALAAAAGLVSRRAAATALPAAILGTGWVSMALEVTLLFAFQVYYGYVYQQLGVITGAFMVGLAWGAMRGARAAAQANSRRAWGLMIGAQLALAAEALLLPTVLHGLSGLQLQSALLIRVLFPVLTALVGLVVGVQFPLAAHLSSAANAAHAGARLYAADLIGACLGAAVAGAMLLPVLGLTGTCLTAAAVSGGLAVLLVLARGRAR